jgi:hypothetical protein
LHCGEDGHPQMFERRVQLTIGPTKSIHGGSTVFVSKLFERHARYIELHDVNGIGKERDWILFKIEDGHSSRGSFAGGHQFAGEPQAAPRLARRCRWMEKAFSGGIGLVGPVKPFGA